MHIEMFLPASHYYLEAAHLTNTLRHEHENLDARRMAVHAALRGAGLELGDLVIVGTRVDPEHYVDLVEQLAVLEPCWFSGQIEDYQVRFVLGEIGNIWPQTIRSDVELQRS